MFKDTDLLFMAHTSVFNIQELLEHILHFLVDKSLYPALFVCWLWYRCGAPILWKRIELKGGMTYILGIIFRMIVIIV